MKQIDAAQREAFCAAARGCGRAMFRAARAVLDSDADAEDAVGEALLRAWQGWPGLKEPEAARAWFLKITVNCAYALRRKYGREQPEEDLEAWGGVTEDRPYEDLWAAVEALPPDGRAVVTLFYYEDMPISEIARVLDVAEGTVKSRLSRAREKLRDMLREEAPL